MFWIFHNFSTKKSFCIMLRRKTKTQGATTQDTATENQFWRLVKDNQGLLSVNGNAPAQASDMSTTNESSSRSFITRVFLRTVLPVGYPQSVAPEYVKFQLYDTLQEASGYFRGLLSTQAYLTGLGVGDESTSPIAAVITGEYKCCRHWHTNESINVLAA